MESNSVCNHTNDKQNRTTAKRESDLLITSMITAWIGRHDVLLPINQNYDKISRHEQILDWALNYLKTSLWMLKYPTVYWAKCTAEDRFVITRIITDRIGLHSVLLRLLIKTIAKLGNVIGYQQPDLSINWTRSVRVMLVIGQYASFCARCCGVLCWVNCWVFQHP